MNKRHIHCILYWIHYHVTEFFKQNDTVFVIPLNDFKLIGTTKSYDICLFNEYEYLIFIVMYSDQQQKCTCV